MSARAPRRLAVPVLLLLTVACQQPPPPPAPVAAPTPTSAPTVPATPSPAPATTSRTATSAPTAASAPTRAATATRPAAATTPTAKPVASPAAAVPVGAARGEVLNAANAAFQAGNSRAAIELYDRVLNTPPAAGEQPRVTAAIDSFARFRAMLALVAAGRDDEARQRLASLREHDPNGPLTRLAAQFWDQYGMTAQPKTACAQLKPQLATAEPVLTSLRAAGVTVEADALCSVPGS